MPAPHPHRIQLQPGYVLHRRPYRETSLLVDVFSREYGKVGLLAKGVRGGKTARVDNLPPFRPLLLSWTGKGELPLLTGAESAAPSPPLQGVALYCGFYLNELLQAFLHRHDPQPLLFECYAGLVAQLPAADDKDRLLRAFELTLLQELGYGLQLHCDAEHHRDIQPGQSYHYVPDRGPIAAPADAGSIRGTTLIALREGRLDDAATRREAKWLLRRVIHHHLAGRPLKSRELFRQKSHESS